MHGRHGKYILTALCVLALGGFMTIGATATEAADSARTMFMKKIGGNMGAIKKVAKGEAKPTAALVNNARQIETLGAVILAVFPKNSQGGRAKPEIWSQPDKFAAAAKALQGATPGLVAAVQTLDPAKIGKALGAVGKTCGGCHKPFREKKK